MPRVRAAAVKVPHGLQLLVGDVDLREQASFERLAQLAPVPPVGLDRVAASLATAGSVFASCHCASERCPPKRAATWIELLRASMPTQVISSVMTGPSHAALAPLALTRGQCRLEGECGASLVALPRWRVGRSLRIV